MSQVEALIECYQTLEKGQTAYGKGGRAEVLGPNGGSHLVVVPSQAARDATGRPMGEL